MYSEIFICQCNSIEHQISITKEEEDIYVLIHLSPKPFLERIIHATKYVFGYRCKYGDWDELILKEEDKQKIIKILS